MLKFSKIVAVVLAIAVIGSFIPVSKAQTAEELNAQIQQLLAMIAQLQGQLAGGGSASASYTYTVDLTLGSKGADVTALQQFLVSKGFLSMPAGAAYGYFGNLSKAALASYQASVGISPAVGYFGPITRAHFNAMVVMPTSTSTVTPTATVSSGPLTGGEGIITVTENGSPAEGVKVYEGTSDAGLLGVKIEADGSDLRIERVKVNIGSAVTAYTKKFDQMSIWDGSSMLQKLDLSSSNVQKEGSDYYVYFTDLNVVIAKDSSKVLTVKGDIYTVVETANQGSHTLTLPANGVRAIDAKGLDIYGPSALFTHAVDIESSLSEQADLSVSRNSSSPKSGPIISNNQGEVTQATVLTVDLKATDGLIYIDQAVVAFPDEGSGNTADVTTAYLFDGSELLQSQAVDGTSHTATFTDLEDLIRIGADTTKTLTVKADYTGATTTQTTSTARFEVGGELLAYIEDGTAETETGSDATSYTQYVSSVSPIFTLVSSDIDWNDLENVTTTDTLTGQIVVSVKADGNDVWIPESGAFDVFLGTTTAGTTSGVTVSYEEPTGVTDGTNADKISDGTTVTYTISVVGTAARITASGAGFYLFAIDNVNWDIEDDATPDRDSEYTEDTLKTGSAYAPAQ